MGWLVGAGLAALGILGFITLYLPDLLKGE